MKKLLQTLLEKWSEYLLEILVITIGILGAFALNNWNENRKADQKEKTLMVNLKRDFELRREELLEFKEARQQAIASIQFLTATIADAENLPPKAQLDSNLMLMLNAMTFNDQFKMLDVLFNTGMINDIRNEDLKELLLLWPQQVEEMMEEQRVRGVLYLEILEPLLMKYIAVRELFELVKFRGYGLPKGLPVRYASDYQGLFQEPSFERHIARLESLLIVNGIDSDILLENADKIINLLEQEISK